LARDGRPFFLILKRPSLLPDWRNDMNYDGLTLEQQRDLDEILKDLQQSINLVVYMNTLGKEINILEKFRFMIDNAAQAKAA